MSSGLIAQVPLYSCIALSPSHTHVSTVSSVIRYPAAKFRPPGAGFYRVVDWRDQNFRLAVFTKLVIYHTQYVVRI